ncbi:MAG TPA: Pvc16 family protein [bacterium]|nr:Pvc16 family protein [bacterium]
MSDYLAVAGVSAVLKWMLSNALTSGGPSTVLTGATSITALSPDLVSTGPEEQPQLNLFMYYASLNAAYRNTALPSRDSQGRRVSNPPLALDLHYLISAYGKNEFDAEIILSWAMQMFHDNPVLSRQTIESSLEAMASGGSPTPEVLLLTGTTLADQFEIIKITPEALSNDEISKLWMAFETHYRPTTSYQVSVVLIQDTASFKSNLPVQSRNIAVLPWQSPIITGVSPSVIGTGEQLTIVGRNFIGDAASDTLIAFGQNPPVVPDTVQNACIRITIPASLEPGVQTLRVVRNVRFGVSTDPHPGFSSGMTAFSLAPTVTTPPPITAAVGTTVTLGVSPAVGRTQQAVLLVGDNAIEIDARPPSDPDTSTTLSFPIPADFPYSTPAVALPMRLQIDGAESRLALDQTPGSPTFGQFLPQMTVTGP